MLSVGEGEGSCAGGGGRGRGQLLAQEEEGCAGGGTGGWGSVLWLGLEFGSSGWVFCAMAKVSQFHPTSEVISEGGPREVTRSSLAAGSGFRLYHIIHGFRLPKKPMRKAAHLGQLLAFLGGKAEAKTIPKRALCSSYRFIMLYF